MFVAGQRYVSDNEPDLGLGLVVGVDGRHIHVRFAADELRIYADHASLTRVLFDVGDEILLDNGRTAVVSCVEIIDGVARYHYQQDSQKNNIHSVMETRLSDKISVQKPIDRLLTCQFDHLAMFDLRQEAWQIISAMNQSPLRGLLGARIEPLAHQLYIAHELSRRHAPRALLADEVGLGKTVQAGLVLHAQLQSGQIHRALVVVPDSLQYQWLGELKRKFNLDFVSLDLERAHADPAGAFLPPLIVCSMDLLLDHSDLAKLACGAGFDMLIVDEAHHLLHQSNNGGTVRGYDVVKSLGVRIPSLLLLTATPEQLGEESHFSHLQLLDPLRFCDFEVYLDEKDNYTAIAVIAQMLLDNVPLSDKRRTALAHLLDCDVSKLDGIQDDEKARHSIISELLERHGTSRVLFRNTRQSIGGMGARVLHTYAQNLPHAWADMNLNTLLWQQPFDDNPKIAWLLDFLYAHKEKKVLIITRSGKMAGDIEAHLRLNHGVKTAAFTEDMTLLERDQAAAYFFDEFGACVLIASEIGSEGRNFQFVSDLVLLDLPPNPDVLEQRIGRLDRIGQKNTVSIHVPFLKDSPEQRLLAWYRALGVFDGISPHASAVHAHYLDLLPSALLRDDLLDTLIDDARVLLAELNQVAQSGRDKLLEYHSCKPTVAARIMDAFLKTDSAGVCELFFERALDVLDIEYHKNRDGIWQVRESIDGQWAHIFDKPRTLTFSREQALLRFDAEFMTLEHPIMQKLFDGVTAPTFGNAVVVALKTPALPEGAILVEFIYRLKLTDAPLSLLPYLGQSVRVLVSGQGDDLTDVVSQEKLTAISAPMPKSRAARYIKNAPLKSCAAAAKRLAQDAFDDALNQVIKAHGENAQKERERLQRLAQASGNVRQSELDAASARLDDGDLLKKATWAQDSVRVYVVCE